MTLSWIRCFFIILSGVVGYYVGTLLDMQNGFQSTAPLPLLGAQIGLVSGLILIFIENKLQRVSVRGLSSVVFGLLLGVFMAKLMSSILALLPLGEFNQAISEIVLTLIFSYFGVVMALRGKDEFNIIIPYVRFRRQDVKEQIILLDTSVIIDGRISDIYKTHFLAGRLVLIRSVLTELQSLADCENDIKRQRGRRGMEIVGLMQNDEKVDIHIHEDDLTSEKTVDGKLITLAKLMEASICTTDFNLGRVAAIQGIEVLNINNLLNSVKVAVFTGDEIEVDLIKKGKESSQAVGYMHDGTMIVVKDAKDFIGQTVKAVITSVLQTQAGKMIFADIVAR